MHLHSFSMAASLTVDLISNTSFMLNFSMAIWLTTRQKAFLSGESPRTSMNWPLVIFSCPLNTSFFNMSNSHGTFSSLKRPACAGNIIIIAMTIVFSVVCPYYVEFIVKRNFTPLLQATLEVTFTHELSHYTILFYHRSKDRFYCKLTHQSQWLCGKWHIIFAVVRLWLLLCPAVKPYSTIL